MVTAKDIMRREIITIGPNVTVGDSIEMLLVKNISGLPVVDDKQQLIGMITEFGLLAAAYGNEVRDQPVSEHMTKDVLTVEADAPLRVVADIFIVHRIRRVPVLENGTVVGFISRRDVLRAIQENYLQESAVATG